MDRKILLIVNLRYLKSRLGDVLRELESLRDNVDSVEIRGLIENAINMVRNVVHIVENALDVALSQIQQSQHLQQVGESHQ